MTRRVCGWSWERSIVAAVCLMALQVSAVAQRQVAVIEGKVTDASGAVVVGAAVSIRDADTNVARTTETDSAGAFRFSDLSVGTYEVRVLVDGFAPYAHAGVIVAIAQTARIAIVLQPAGVNAEVSVSAQPPPLDSRQTSIATAIDIERIEELPVRSRNYLEFVLLAPGVTRAAAPAAGAITSVVPGSGFSFDGLRPRSNTLMIDGIDNTDEFSGSSRTELSLEVVREFQVVRGGWLAESGGGSAGSINVVTKSGANTRHGDAFVFGQSGILNARPKLEDTLGADPALRRFRAGGAIGGPIAKDRTFFYAGGEREGTTDQTASDIGPSTARAINSALGTRTLTIGVFPTARRETEASVKISHVIDGRGSLVGAVAANQSADDHDAFNRGGLSDRSARGSSTARDVALTGSWNTALTARSSNELRGQYAVRRQTIDTTDDEGPGVMIAGAADFGTSYFGDSDRGQRYIDVADTLAHVRGQHLLKGGAGFKRITVDAASADGVRGVEMFASLSDFFAGHRDLTRRMSGEARIFYAATRAYLFVQDHWTPTSALTIDAGARIDVAAFPSTLQMISRQAAPRIGIAWTPDPRWVVRGGAGLFADRIALASIERALITGHAGIVEQIGNAAATPSIYTVRRGQWNPASLQGSAGVERLLTPNLTAAVTYSYAGGRRLPRTVNVNLAPPTIVTPATASALGLDAPTPQQLGRPVFGPERLNAAWDGIFEMQPTAASTYQGVTFAANRRLADEIEWAWAYTWSHARDSASDFDEQPQNPYDLDDEWADSRYDQRHRLTASALFDLPIGEEEDRKPGEVPGAWIRAFSHIEVASILTMGSGSPVNALTGGDDNRTHAFPLTSRPLGFSRNAARLRSFASLDLRVLKFFAIKPHGKLDLVVEAFNLLNRTNVSQINSVYGPLLTPRPAFGRAIEAGAARQIQFSFDFEF